MVRILSECISLLFVFKKCQLSLYFKKNVLINFFKIINIVNGINI